MLLGLCGSLRSGSYNLKLMREAAGRFGADKYVEGDLRLPLFDADLQSAQGIPESVQRLSDQIAQADAVIIATPEYNKMLSGVLKNALDWVSRTEGNPWLDKPVAIMSAAGGRSGGERAQASLRLALAPFSPLLLQGRDVLVAGARTQFDENDKLTSERYQAALERQLDALRSLTRAAKMLQA